MNITILKRPDPQAPDKLKEEMVTKMLNEQLKERLQKAFEPLEPEFSKFPDHKIIMTNEDELAIQGLPPQICYQIEYIYKNTKW